jgi:hypothetical protein
MYECEKEMNLPPYRKRNKKKQNRGRRGRLYHIMSSNILLSHPAYEISTNMCVPQRRLFDSAIPSPITATLPQNTINSITANSNKMTGSPTAEAKEVNKRLDTTLPHTKLFDSSRKKRRKSKRNVRLCP